MSERQLENLQRQIDALSRKLEDLLTQESGKFVRVNIGSVTGAAAGEIKASDDGIFGGGLYVGSTSGSPSALGVVESTGKHLVANSFMMAYENTSLASGSTISTGLYRGMVLISNVTDNILELILTNSGGTMVSVAQRGLVCNLGSDAGSTIAVYLSGGAILVKNRYATTKSVRVQVFAN